MIKKLNFGCDTEIRKGWDNADISGPANLKFDFNKFPFPIKDNVYDFIYTRSVLEHLDKPGPVLLELARICKPGAIIEIIVPHYNNKSAYSDIQHTHFFNEDSFTNFVKFRAPDYFELNYIEVVPTWIGRLIPTSMRKKISLFIMGLDSYVYVKLKVK